MSFSPIEHIASQRIGSVESVAPDKIKVALDLDAPDGIAANTGIPRIFPRINNYVLISAESGYIVSQIEWISVESSPFPKRKGFKDYGLIDLPFPLRKMQVNPLGILRKKHDENDIYNFQRGVQTFPSIGEPVLLPTDNQLKAIIESGQNKRVKIGTSPLAANANVYIDPDRLFGRHLAVLGNTGSGKSCSVAGLIQWSLQAAYDAKDKTANKNKNLNARFIILDPNGEYTKVFGNKGNIFKVNDSKNPLQIPLWLWNSAEWCSFTQAQPGAQAPILRQALRSMRNNTCRDIKNDKTAETKTYIKNLITIFCDYKNSPAPYSSNYGKISPVVESIPICKDALMDFNDSVSIDLSDIIEKLESLYTKHFKDNESNGHKFRNYIIFTPHEFDKLILDLKTTYELLGGNEQELLLKNEDTPIQFNGEEFVDYIEALAQNTRSVQFFEFFLARLRTMLADNNMKKIIDCNDDITLESWLNRYIGHNNMKYGRIAVVDLSLVPSQVIHIITAVIARMTLESLQRYRSINGKSLPTVLVMEEAHNFIKKYKEEAENPNPSSVCCQIFEKIAREGRKFGLGLVLSSQRPSELSPTVLSQCNTFLLHRISNDDDQKLISRLVPDNFRGLLSELPSLPSQQAILLGWAAELPTMVHMNYLPEEQRPDSKDPQFWDVWCAKESRKTNWKAIANDWQKGTNSSEDVLTNVREETSPDCSDNPDAENDSEIPF